MNGVKRLDREGIVTFLVGKGFDRDVLDLCSKEWLLEILERQLTPEALEDDEEWIEEQYPDEQLDDKEELRLELEKAVKDFLASGRSVTHCKAQSCVPPGEAGLSWAREIWPDE